MIIPEDIIQVLSQYMEPPSLLSLALTNKDNYSKCLRPRLLERVLKKYQVDYNDSYSLVHRYKPNRFYLKPRIHITIVVLFVKYCNMYTLYKIECNDSGVTSIPLLPNVEILLLDSNNIQTLPYLDKVRVLSCSRNNITHLKMYPDLDTLECQFNKIQSIPEYPKLDVLCAWGNKIVNVPRIPTLGFYMIQANNPVILRS